MASVFLHLPLPLNVDCELAQMILRSVLFSIWLFLPSVLAGQDAATSTGKQGATTIQSKSVRLTKIDGSTSSVESVSVGEGKISTADGEFDLNEFRLIDFEKPVQKSVSSKVMIGLSGGGRLGAKSVRLEDDAFIVDNVAGEISLGVEAVSQIVFKQEPLPLFEETKAKSDVDQLVVKIKGNYRTVSGIVESIGEDKITILYEEDSIDFKTADAYGLLLARDPEIEEPQINSVVVLTDGSKVSCLLNGLANEQLLASIGELSEIVLPLPVISKIEIRSDRLAFLSDLEPKSVSEIEGSVFKRRWRSDVNIVGGPLVLRDRIAKTTRTYSKGLGTKSGMKLQFENNGFDKFVALLGIDASTNGNGDCKVFVFGDGKKLYENRITGNDSPKALDLEISGIETLELSVEFGDDFLDLSDHLNWCDARFVKNSK